MSVRIRLQRGGRKKLPCYTIVVADSRAPRDGRFIEAVGYYQPWRDHSDYRRCSLKMERIQYWKSCGAHCSERVEKLTQLQEKGLLPAVPAA